MQETTKKRGGRTKKAEEAAVKQETLMTEEATEKAPETTAKAPENSTFTLEQVQKMIEEALQKRDAEAKKAEGLTAASTDGVVTMFFQAEVNDANEIHLGPNGKFGTITGRHATITIPKRDFIGEFRTTTVQNLLKNRNLIVTDGLTDSERKIYGVDYRQGEYLEPEVYQRLIDMGDKVLEIFGGLNVTWHEMIASKFAEAYENKTLKCSRECLVKLNKMSKKDYKDLPKGDERKKGGFYGIIHQMNAADENDEDE